MLKITGSEDYYPTPEKLLDRITAGVKWLKVDTVLEPSAGKGNIAEYVLRQWKLAAGRWGRELDDIDCIEIEPELRSILKGKNLRVVHDDFLTFHTYKHYDLIFMNPPFSSGAKHLLKALEVQQLSGGAIICILNAETLRNPYSNERKDLAQKLESYNAEVNYYENAFLDAERPTDVEIAVVKVIVPVPERQTTIFDTLREKKYTEAEKKSTSEITEADFVKAFVALYNREVEWGLRLYDEFLDLNANALDGEGYINFHVKHEGSLLNPPAFTRNGYVREVRRKYWYKLFRSDKFIAKLTSELQKRYISRVEEFVNYDFSYWNIKTIQQEVALQVVQGVEDSIVDLFDKLSYQHAYDDELKHNIHYYNGWKTNNAYRINKRVILPLNVYEYGYLCYGPISWLIDIERVFNYLDNGETTEVDMQERLDEAQKNGQTRNIELKYFLATFYKKGTCHLTFTNERLLKKFNIFGSQKKGWLPKGYAKRSYQEMTPEEQSVIESFEGEASYMESYADAQYYLFDVARNMPMLGGGEKIV